MIRFYHKTAKSKNLSTLNSYKKGSWVYVEAPSSAEISQLVKKFDLDEGHIADAMDIDEVPRMEREDDQIYIFSRFPFTDNDLQLDTSTILFIIHPESLISISPMPLPRLDKFVSGKIPLNTTHKVKVMLLIMDQVDDLFENYTAKISKQIRSIRTRLRREQIKNKDFVDFVLIEDELNEFMAALSPMNALLRRLLLGKHIKLHDEDRDLIEDLMLNNEQSIEAAKSNIKSITNIREAYSTIMSNNLNRVIRILTVATVVISVPTLVASIYGMNIELPFSDSPAAFGGVVVGSLLLSMIMIWIFRIKRWL